KRRQPHQMLLCRGCSRYVCRRRRLKDIGNPLKGGPCVSARRRSICLSFCIISCNVHISFRLDGATANCSRNVAVNESFLVAPCTCPLCCQRHPIAQQSLVFLREACPVLQLLQSLVRMTSFVI